MHSLNHHLISIRVAFESLPAMGYEMPPSLEKFRDINTVEENQALTLHQSLTFLRELRRHYPSPRLALDMAQAFPPQAYGMLGYGLLSASSVRETLEFVVRFQRLTYTVMSLSLDVGPELTRFSFSADNLPIERDLALFIGDRDLASTQVSFRAPQNQTASPISVTLPHDGFGIQEVYENYYGCPIEFNGDYAALIYRTEEIDYPALYRNSEAFELCKEACEKQLAKITYGNDLTSQVREELHGRPGYLQDIDSIAQRLKTSARTLRRRLADQDQTFQGLQQEVRFEQARDYLSRPGLSVSEVSDLLGFSEPGNFTQAFKRWSGGLSPRQYRQQV